MIKEVVLPALDNMIRGERKDIDRDVNHSSEAGWALTCMRHFINLRIRPEKMDEKSIESLRIFHEGHVQEQAVVKDLQGARLDVISLLPEDRKTFYSKDLDMVSELDTMIKIDGVQYPLELKSADPNVFRVLRRAEVARDLLESNFWWVRNYPAQLWIQTLMAQADRGAWLFKDKSRGTPHIIETSPDEGSVYLRELFDAVHLANEFIAEKQAPDPQPIDACHYCAFRADCFEETPVSADDGNVHIIDDPEVMALFMKWHELQPFASKAAELERASKELRDMFPRGMNIRCGDFGLDWSSYPKKSYDIPDAEKKKYEITKTVFQGKIKFFGEKF